MYRLKAAPGQTLDGRFLLLEEIGRGGMATVFKARDLEDDELVAVKVPHAQFSSGVGSWSMFQREAEIGCMLRHPYILRFIDLPQDKRRDYVVTEYLQGAPLADRVGMGKRLAEQEAIAIMSRVCEAVEHLHAQGIVHYDLKPANVLLLDGDATIRLIDFGTAHRLEAHWSPFAAPAPPLVSAGYAAPEQIRRARGRPSVDTYAIGAMLYEVFTGHTPFEGDDPSAFASARQIGDPIAPRALNPDLSRQAEEIVLRALRRNPAERYPNVAALRHDLTHLDQVQVSGLAERLVAVTPWRKRIHWLRYAALIGVLPLASLVAMFLMLWWYLDHRH